MSTKKSVLVVDDDAAAATSVAALMATIDLDVRIFASAEEFFDVYDGNGNGCLILDIRLGGMSGIELHRKLRDRGDKIPTIFCSGHADEAMCEQALQDGAVACLEKPYSATDLCDLVLTALSRN